MPTYVGLTPGTQYLPFPEQRFTLGGQVTTVEELGAGGLFLIESDECEYITEDGKKMRNGGFWHSPYGAHMAANAAALVYLIPTIGENAYKVAWLNNSHFIKTQQTTMPNGCNGPTRKQMRPASLFVHAKARMSVILQ